jgi:hypothetical protein
LALALAGCNPVDPPMYAMEASSSSGSEAGIDTEPRASGGTSLSAGASSDGGTTGEHPPLRCRPGESQCGNECVDLRGSEEHCGTCGHACTAVGLSGLCEEGACLPRRYCALAEQGHTTCASVCEQYGETCVDTEPSGLGACGGGRYGLFYELTPNFACDRGYGSVSSVPGLCQDLIQWDLASPEGGNLPGAVGCCCTQL